MTARRLACPNGCAVARFEAVGATLVVDESGGYVEHDDSGATYLCTLCGAVAVDLRAAAREMEEETTQAPSTLVCPVCSTEMLPPEDDPLASLVECPVCGQRFAVEEGLPRLHGGAPPGGDGDGAGR